MWYSAWHKKIFSLFFLFGTKFRLWIRCFGPDPGYPEYLGRCAVKAVHRSPVTTMAELAGVCLKSTATSGHWHSSCPSDTDGVASHWLHLPGKRCVHLAVQKAFFGFYLVLFLWNSKAHTILAALRILLRVWTESQTEIASSIFLRAPKVVIPSSFRSWSVSVRNVWRSISCCWKTSVYLPSPSLLKSSGRSEPLKELFRLQPLLPVSEEMQSM